MIHSFKEVLPKHPFFAGFDDTVLDLLAGCATNVHFDTGQVIFREGESADTFYIIRKGRVAIQMHHTASGARILDTADEDDVLGWSWIVPPYRWMFDARASVPTSAVAFDGACLRGKCEQDPAVGYALLQRTVAVMRDRLEAARVRLLDLYGGDTQ